MMQPTGGAVRRLSENAGSAKKKNIVFNMHQEKGIVPAQGPLDHPY